MAPRANWKGHLKLSLVSCPVALYGAATESQRVSFNTLNTRTQHRLKRQFIDPDTGEVVEPEHQVKGYEIGKGQYVYLEQDELDRAEVESTHVIEVDSFVPRSDFDIVYRDKPYYLAPDGHLANEIFAVIRATMEKEGTAALARIVLYRRERRLLIEPRGKGMLATTLFNAAEVRAASEYFDEIPDIEIPQEMLDLAGHIIETKLGHFDPNTLVDRYEEGLVELIRAKQAGRPIKVAEPRPPEKVVDLMEALLRSVEAEGGRPPPRPPASAPERRRAAGAKTSRAGSRLRKTG